MCPTNLVKHSIGTTQNPNHEMQSIKRSTADYPPSIWGDLFLNCAVDSSDMNEVMKAIDELKEDVKNILTDLTQNEHLKKLEVIDTIQRLGLSYHFEKEIGAILEQIYNSTKDNEGLKMKGDDQSEDLHCVSLWFRLLRQQGYSVSSDVFNKLELEKMLASFKLDSAVCENTLKGVLSLYEAMELRKHGDDELDELHAYVTVYLESVVASLNPFLKSQVSHALNRSLRKGMPRIEARHFISIYEQQSHHSQILLTFAKLDFNHLQKLHLQELSNLTRWESDAADSLPEYMQHVFHALLAIYMEMEDAIASHPRKSSRIHYAKASMKRQVRAYFEEAKWFHEKYMPTMEEYMSLATETTAYPTLMIHSLVGMGDDVVTDNDPFEWISQNPKTVKAASVLSRLMDDIVSHEFEQKRGHVASAVECYTKQYGVTENEAVKIFRKEISSAWKDMNEAYMRPTLVPMAVLDRILNLNRVMDVIYKDEDGYTLGGLKHYITPLLIEPVKIINTI